MNLQYTVCNLCGADHTKILCTVQGMHIQSCECCGLVYVNPRIFDPTVDTMYDADFFAYYVMAANTNKHTYIRRLKLMEKFMPGKGRLLDIGCAIGDFLEIAQARGWAPCGIDVSPVYADSIRTRLCVPMMVGDFNDVFYPPEVFDAVTMGDSIEHMLDPRGAVRKVFSILRPGGIGYIRTPDISHLMPRLTGKRWIQLKPFEHFYYFSRTTLRRLLEEEGFRILKIGSSGVYCSLNVLRDRLKYYYNPTHLIKIIDFFSDTLHLGNIQFYLDPLEEMQVVFQKPSQL